MVPEYESKKYSGAIKTVAKSLTKTITDTVEIMGLSSVAGNYVHIISTSNKKQSFMIPGGVPGEKVTIELLDCTASHKQFLLEWNCGEREFDENGQIEFKTICGDKNHDGNRDVYKILWNGEEHIYTITYKLP